MFLTIATFQSHDGLMENATQVFDEDGHFDGHDYEGRSHYKGGWALCWPVHNWLAERQIEYRLYWARISGSNEWEIEFDDCHFEEMMLFRLKFL